MTEQLSKGHLPTSRSATQKLALVALGAGAFASVLAGGPESVVTLDHLVPTTVVESSTDATTHHQQGEDWKPPLNMFQGKAMRLLDLLAGNSGIAVDWSRVDPESVSVPPSDFNFRFGTVFDALNEYMLWPGLLVSEGRSGEPAGRAVPADPAFHVG